MTVIIGKYAIEEALRENVLMRFGTSMFDPKKGFSKVTLVTKDGRLIDFETIDRVIVEY
jgi:hypothetical protein